MRFVPRSFKTPWVYETPTVSVACSSQIFSPTRNCFGFAEQLQLYTKSALSSSQYCQDLVAMQKLDREIKFYPII